ncbi:hypothetical protein D1007_07497 [Hordeum vulgare]|nr:hypothetical protein D1007_07497 [Hordeum vulgare]
MTGQVDSVVTADLQLASLELDIKILQNNREEDRKEFQEFRAMVNKNFFTMQGNFHKIQNSFRKLLMDHGSEEEQLEHSEQGSAPRKVDEGQQFTNSFRVLQLKGYDMILVVDWLKKYNRVHMDFIKMEMKVSSLDGQLVTFADETMPRV